MNFQKKLDSDRRYFDFTSLSTVVRLKERKRSVKLVIEIVQEEILVENCACEMDKRKTNFTKVTILALKNGLIVIEFIFGYGASF